MVVKIKHMPFEIKDLVCNYSDNKEEGVFALNGKLNVRPKYQREWVYGREDRAGVIQSVYNDLPLNSMYWAVNPDGSYEVIDGQQRIISICQFVKNSDENGNPIAVNFDDKRTQTFDGLSEEDKERFLHYKLQVYVCDGSDDDKLKWFNTINIAGKQMEKQELLNANYTGEWLTCAKRYFSKKNNNEAINFAYYNNDERDTLLAINGEGANRQRLLELVLSWICDFDKSKYPEIRSYMGLHRQDVNADELINYYKAVINWVKKTFVVYYREMKGLDWGLIYNSYHNNVYDVDDLNLKIKTLMLDDEVTKKSGIFEYVLSGNEKYLSLRSFPNDIKRIVYENQKGICPRCGNDKHYKIEEMEADHIKPWSEGGKTTEENCQMLCKHHNRTKSAS